jgi:hypothetical protein
VTKSMVGSLFFSLLISLNFDSISCETGSWIRDDQCARTYSEELIDSLVIDRGLTIHSCSKEEMNQHSLDQPKPLRWSHYHHDKAKLIWEKLYQQMAKKKLLMIGDSVMFEVSVALVLYLHDIGITCESSNRRGYWKCPNEMEIISPYKVAKLTDEYLPEFPLLVGEVDLILINSGVHYGTSSCYGDPPNPMCHDIEQFFHTLQANITRNQLHVKLAWMDTFRPHFASSDGSYFQWKSHQLQQKSELKPVNIKCDPISTPMSYQYSLYDGSHLMRKQFSTIPVVSTYDLVFERYDIHQGLLTHLDPERLDCVHLCIQPCYWAPILNRIGKVLLGLL